MSGKRMIVDSANGEWSITLNSHGRCIVYRKRFLMVGEHVVSARDGQTHYIDPARLVNLYKIPRQYCVLHGRESFEHALSLDLNEYTVLRPIADGNYRCPQVEATLSDAFIDTFTAWITPHYHDSNKVDRYKDTFLAMLMADTLQEEGFNDPNFPWLLNALRDPTESPTIYQQIWSNIKNQIIINRLIGSNFSIVTLDNATPEETSNGDASQEKQVSAPRRKVEKRVRK